MNREIKFRARWKDTGEIIPDFMEQYTIEALNDESSIVEQFTGLLDKNGKEIYQGDILKLNNNNYDPEYEGFYTGLAVVEAQTCGYSLKPIPKLEEPNIYDSSMFWHVGEEDTTEVIGNIYENPELLNDEDEPKN